MLVEFLLLLFGFVLGFIIGDAHGYLDGLREVSGWKR